MEDRRHPSRKRRMCEPKKGSGLWEFISVCLFIYLFIYLVCFLGLHSRHVEVARLGGKLELQLLAYATAAPDPSHICNLHHSSTAVLDP